MDDGSKQPEVVWEGDEMSGGLMHLRPVTCPVCDGLGSILVGPGELPEERRFRRAKRARNQRCHLCRGRGWVLS